MYDEPKVGRGDNSASQRPRRQFRRRLTWPSPGSGVGICLWVSGIWARVAPLPRIGGDPADV